jgi:hypothetical protein
MLVGLRAAAGFPALLSLILGTGVYRTARSGQGRAERRGAAVLDREDRSEIINTEGKEGKSILETQISIEGGDGRVSTMVLSETRGL